MHPLGTDRSLRWIRKVSGKRLSINQLEFAGARNKGKTVGGWLIKFWKYRGNKETSDPSD